MVKFHPYAWMLERAYKLLPPIVFAKERWEMPKFVSSIEGNRTVIKNFVEVAQYLNRDPKHILKFLGREIGAAGRIEGNRAILVGRFGSILLNQKLEKYVKTYVICPVCGKPDTKIVKVDRIPMLKCLACGALSPLPPL